MTHNTVMLHTHLNTDCCSTVKQLAGLLAIQNYKLHKTYD